MRGATGTVLKGSGTKKKRKRKKKDQALNNRIRYSQGLLLVTADLLVGVLLVLAEELRPELDVSGLVNTVDVTKTGSDREVGRDGVKGRVDIPDVLGLGVERVVVDRGVVNTVLLTTGDTDFHFKPD